MTYNSLRTFCLVTAVSLSCAAYAHAEPGYTFDLASQPLGDAVRALGRQTGANIVVDADVGLRISPAVKGQMTVAKALERLTTGADASVKTVGDRSFLIIGHTSMLKKTSSVVETRTETAADVRAASAPDAGSSPALEEIVVTAQKREERLQDVPVAVTPLTSKQLEVAGATSTMGLTSVTPGLIMTRNVAVAQPTIRGIGGRNTAASDEGTVPIYIDGVYQSMMQTGFFDFNNIDRIEVLKGPQGTLFGRNAMGGAINITTTQPSQQASAKLSASYARFGNKVGDFYGNLPLGQTLAANIAIHSNADDGYVRDLTTGSVNRAQSSGTSGRAKVLWNPLSDLQVTAGVSHVSSSDNSAISAFPLNGDTIARQVSPNVVLAGPFQQSDDFKPQFKVKQDEAFVSAKIALNGFDIGLLSSYENSEALIETDYDATLVPYGFVILPYGSKAYTDELKVSSNSTSALKWIGGLYYYSEQGHQGTSSDFYEIKVAPTGTTTVGIIDTTVASVAAYAEATLALTKQLSATAGVRYTDEKRGLDQSRSLAVNGQAVTTPTPFANASTSFSKTSPRFTVQYAFTDKIHSYITYSQGFKSGVYNGGTFISLGVAPAAVRPEVLNAVEAGFKTEPFRSVRLNISIFDYDYQNLQVSTRSPTTGATILQNAAAAKNYGGEAELTWALTSSWNVVAGVALEHARFSSFPSAQIYAPLASGAGNASSFGDVSGKAIPRAPDQTANITTDYTMTAFGGKLVVSGTYFWSSDYYWDLGNNFDNQGAHDDLTARVAWTSPDQTHRLSVFGTNLTNSRTPIVIQPSGGGTYASYIKPWVLGAKYELFLK